MNHQQIDQLVKTFNIDTAKGQVNPRVQEITVRLVADLFKAIEDLDMSPHEVWKGMEFLIDAAKANEIGLFAAGLGLERFVDIRADEAEEKAASQAARRAPSKARCMFTVRPKAPALPAWTTAPNRHTPSR